MVFPTEEIVVQILALSPLKSYTTIFHNSNIVLSSIIGRYYAMDRDQRWERIKKAYDLLVDGVGEIKEDYSTAFKESYSNKITDEFLEPVKIKNNKGTILDNDLVVCF